MHLLSRLALFFWTVSLSVVAQVPSPPDASVPGAAAGQTAAPTPAATNPEHAEIKTVVKSFVQALLALDARGATHLTASPFYLEGARHDGEEAISQALIRQLRSKRTDLLTLYGVEVFTLDELEAKYGKAPARLSAMPVRERGAMFAVANLSGRAAVMMLKVVGGQWRVVGYHD